MWKATAVVDPGTGVAHVATRRPAPFGYNWPAFPLRRSSRFRAQRRSNGRSEECRLSCPSAPPRASLDHLSPRDRAMTLPSSPPRLPPRTRSAWFRTLTRPRLVLPVLLVLASVITVAAWRIQRQATLEWARNTAIPEIQRLAGRGANVGAFFLARELETRLPGDPRLPAIWDQIAFDVRWHIEPDGAAIFVRSRGDRNGTWQHLGRATGQPLRTPTGYLAVRLEATGHEPVETVLMGERAGQSFFVLPAAGEVPLGMVRVVSNPVAGTDFTMNLFNYERPRSASVASFLMDRYEVTNAEFKKFVDAGGYWRREFWKEVFVEDGKVLAWDDAMTRFRDTTGLPGPATWELGYFRDGRGDYPVSGVSWYEAAAYAEFAGKRLPAVHHWGLAGGTTIAGLVLPGSNFSNSLAPVGSFRDSLTDTGLYDTAGNAREWCSNATAALRFTVGGAADGPDDFFVTPEPRAPFDRDPMNGFRCMRPLMPGSTPAELDLPILRRTLAAPDPSERLDDRAWNRWLDRLTYQVPSLDSKAELTDDAPRFWTMEKVSFTAAYESDRVIVYLFLPKNASPPYQCVIYWGDTRDWLRPSSEDGRALLRWPWDYLVKARRAVIYPVLKGMFERRVLLGDEGIFGARERLWTDTGLTAMSAKDISRSIDYLETRSDLDLGKLALLGFGSGAYYALLPCAAESRIRTCILQGGGASYPGVLGWARRVTVPVLMVNGRYDTLLPYEEAQRPLFDALATPLAKKRHEVLPTDHGFSDKEKAMMRVTLEWLDTHLGTVK